MIAVAAGLWGTAAVAVIWGPWPLAMVHFPGLEHSPTHPPTPALLLFGAAYSARAIAVAPAVSGWLGRHARVWAAVLAANAVAMSVYLWHFTAAIAAGAALHGVGWLPTAEVGTPGWWLEKLPHMALSSLVLGAGVLLVAGTERRALLAPRKPFVGGAAQMLGTAVVISVAVKAWANGSVVSAVAGMCALIVVWYSVLQRGPGSTKLEPTPTHDESSPGGLGPTAYRRFMPRPVLDARHRRGLRRSGRVG